MGGKKPFLVGDQVLRIRERKMLRLIPVFSGAILSQRPLGVKTRSGKWSVTLNLNKLSLR